MTPSGQIFPRSTTGNCAKHQRKLATLIKRATHMGIFSHKKSKWTVFYPLEMTAFENIDTYRDSWTLYDKDRITEIDKSEAIRQSEMNELIEKATDEDDEEDESFIPDPFPEPYPLNKHSKVEEGEEEFY